MTLRTRFHPSVRSGVVPLTLVLLLPLAGCAEHTAEPAAASGAATAPRTTAEPSPADQAIDQLADRYLAAYWDTFPESATAEGVPGADDAGLSDNSLTGIARWQAVEDATLAELRAVSPDGLSPTARRTRRFLIDLLDAALGKRVCRDELWAVSPTYTGWQAGFAYLASIQPVATAADRQAALARFGALPGWIDEEVENLRRGLELGYTAPRINVERVIEQMDSLTAGPPADSPFYSPAQRAGDDPDFARRMGDTIEEGINPAIRHYREFLADEYLPRARQEIAVAANPDGEECYRASVRYHTSVERGPQAIHQLGLEQMAKITAQMQRIGTQSFGTGNVRELLELVTSDPRYTFGSRQEVVDYATAAVQRAEQAVPRWFGLVPDAEVVVVPYPEFRERSAPGAEYSSASDDGSRPGTFYINTYEPETQSKAGIEATAFHETYPGHHLQGSIAKQFATGHPVQRYFGTSGFSEGWGLYSERLAEEMGIYSGDVDLLGLLSNEALRAARLVVDSGMHGLGWSRQQAIDYVLAHTAESPTRAAAEVDRYIAVPGQATAYMIGNLEIRRLRDLAERELGDDFEVKEFHDRVLEDGAVTLPMLADKIQSWISDEKAAATPGG